MEQHNSQEEVRRNIISDMVKKRNVCIKPNADMPAYMLRREKRRMKSNSIIPVIGEDTIVYKTTCNHQFVSYHMFGQAKDGSFRINT